ncbi:MAG: hypothetical protein NTW49_06640 [Bacteroidia bacterium]|nr:hypothetical protein [Bacteroidia bacterium]
MDCITFWQVEFNYKYTGTIKDVNGCVSTPFDIFFQFNHVPVPTISGPTPVCDASVSNVYTTQSGMSNYLWTVTGGNITGGGSTSDYSVTVTWSGAGTGHVKVNYTNPATGCTAAAQTDYPVTINPLPVVNSVTLQANEGIVGPSWTWPVGGTYPNFNMCIDPLINPASYYLDVNTFSSTPNLMADYVNGFKLDQTGLTQAWWDYWSARGVNGPSGNAYPWQDEMWRIIHGTDPFFYLELSGGDYIIVDGLHYILAGNIDRTW